MPRLFTAIDIPPDIKNDICAIHHQFKGVRWIPKEQLHITLHFLGEVEQEAFEKVKKALNKVRVEEFSLKLAGIGFFPNKRRPSIFWIGIEDNPVLNNLKKEVDIVLEPLGCQPEKREFVPHLTIARIKRGASRKISDLLLETSTELKPASCRIKTFFLYSSQLSPEGAIHTKEAEYPNNS